MSYLLKCLVCYFQNGSIKHKQTVKKTKVKVADMTDNNKAPYISTVYLVTYSQASDEWSRESFAPTVTKESENGTAKTLQWVCSKEEHRNGGVHFHLAVKLDRPKRWLYNVICR